MKFWHSQVFDWFRFQIGWFACVGLSISWAVAISGVLLLAHFFLIAWHKEWRVILVITLLGWGVDSLLCFFGILVIQPASNFAPFWLALAWCHFAATLRHSMIFFVGKPLISMIFFMIVGPLAYLGGSELNPTISLGISQSLFLFYMAMIWLVWGAILPPLAEKLCCNRDLARHHYCRKRTPMSVKGIQS